MILPVMFAFYVYIDTARFVFIIFEVFKSLPYFTLHIFYREFCLSVPLGIAFNILNL